MRLIDADKLKKEIHCTYSDDLVILEKIENQPTAFDVEKVANELDDLKMRYFLTLANTGDADKDCASLNTANAIDRAIEIVKRGGVDEDYWK
mgnify:CR=1 FL=1